MSQVANLPSSNEMGVAMEAVLIDGDLAKLSAEQRVQYYKKTCDSLGLNYLTQPFAYIKLNGKLLLYARKECTEQLRSIHDVSIFNLTKETFDGVYVVTANAKTAKGKEDASTGAVTIIGLKGEALANAFMKAETKAKRRVTLSLCGLGYLDESEVSSIPDSRIVNVNHETGEVMEDKKLPEPLGMHRDEILNRVNTAANLTELKNAYALAYSSHAGNLENMKDITQAKDARKSWLEADATIIRSDGSIS